MRWPVGRGHNSYLLLRGSVDAGSTYPCAGPYGRGQTPHLPMRWSLWTRAHTQLTLTLCNIDLSLSLSFSMAHGSLALALCELAGSRHGGSAPTRPRGALAPRSGDVPPSRVSATPWPGAAPPSQLPRAPPRCRRTRPGASSAARRTRAGPLAHDSPAGATQACRRRMHSLLSRAAHLCARCWLFLARVTPKRPPPLRQSVVPRSAHGPRFHKRHKKQQAF